MEVKLIRVLDRMTEMVLMAVKLRARNINEVRYLVKTGFWDGDYIMVGSINGGHGSWTCDFYDWGQGERTRTTAHKYINEHWDKLQPGDTICVQCILKEHDHERDEARERQEDLEMMERFFDAIKDLNR